MYYITEANHDWKKKNVYAIIKLNNNKKSLTQNYCGFNRQKKFIHAKYLWY